MADRRPRNLTATIVIGILAVPLAAVASVSLLGSATATPEPSEAIPAVVQDERVTTTISADSIADDLAVACGEAGLRLVEAEASGTITVVQQAALDALRPICEGEGSPLPGPPEPEPVTRTVTVQSPVAPTSPAAAQVWQAEDDDDHEEFEEHEDEEDHENEDHEDGERHEDEDHEDD